MSCDHSACFYCEMPLSAQHEHDHFPIPENCGGTGVVPCCINCHNLKDRDEMTVAHLVAFVSLWPQLNAMERVTLARLLALGARLVGRP